MSRIDMTVFGTCSVTIHGDKTHEIRGAKHRALFALLATAPMGRRSRGYLQETLWGVADYDAGHQNLRRALSDLRKAMGDAFDSILTTTPTDVQLSLDRLSFTDTHGEFLEDLDIREAAFLRWRDDWRARPEELARLCQHDAHHRVRKLRPTFCALPLTTPDADPQMRVLSDWIAEEIGRTVSRSSLLTVISHLSGRRMATKMIDLADVRRTLDADYVVTGTLRQQQSEMICDLDFIDTKDGRLLWSRNIVVPMAGASAGLSEGLGDIIRAIGQSVAERTLRSVREHRVPEIPDHELLIAGVSEMHRRRLSNFLSARRYLEEATRRAPHEPDVHAWLGKWFVLNVFKGYTTDRAGDTRRALECTSRALDIDPDSSFALTIDGFVHGNILGHFDEAGERYAAALDRNHNESLGWLLRGSLLAFQDKGDAAVHATETARRLSPIDPFGYYFDSLCSTAHLSAGNFNRALAYAERSLAVNDRHISTLRAKITALHFLGDAKGATRTAEELRQKFPHFDLETYRRTHPSMDGILGGQAIEALSAAGLS